MRLSGQKQAARYRALIPLGDAAMALVLYIIAIVLLAIAAFMPKVGGASPVHLGWLGLAFFAGAHVVGS